MLMATAIPQSDKAVRSTKYLCFLLDHHGWGLGFAATQMLSAASPFAASAIPMRDVDDGKALA